MPRFVALLRALNVGGTAVVPMAKLRKAFEAQGLADVATVGASGNVLFTADATPAAALAKVHAAMTGLRLKPKAVVRTPRQLQAALDANPLAPSPAEQCQLLFLDAKPKAAAVERLVGMAAPEYRIAVVGDVCYYAYDRTWAGKRRQLDFERVLGVAGTARTARVVGQLAAAGPP